MINFKTVRYKNFLSVGNLFLEIPLDRHQSTLIVGKNGSGKSTMLDAICFALFGKAFRNINKPQLVNSITQKNLLVELEFTIGASKYLIRRGIKPAVFEVHKNGEMLNQDGDSRDYQNVLESQILKFNYKSFRQIVILGTASFVPFMALPLAQRREIIEDLLDLQIFSTMNVLVKQRMAANEDAIDAITAKQILLREKIRLYNQYMEESQKDNDHKIANLQGMIANLNAKIGKAKIDIEATQKRIDEYNDIILNLPDHTAKIHKLEKFTYKVNAEIAVLKKEVTFFQKHTDCPTCRQQIDELFRQTTVEKKQKKIKKANDGLNAIFEELSLYGEGIRAKSNLREEVNAIQYTQHELQRECSFDATSIECYQREIERLKTYTPKLEEFHIEQLNSDLEASEEEYKQAIEDAETLKAAATLLKDGGIKAKIIKQYIPIINKLINKYLSALDFFVQFELNESFEETIKSRYRDEFSYESFSEGEKKRINLAIIFAWRAIAKMRNSANTNLFILDEIFDSSLDLTGMEDVLKLLLSTAAENNTFIISHNPSTGGDRFNHILRFEKKQNFTRMLADG